MQFVAHQHRAGKWLKFELGAAPQLIVVSNGGVHRGALVDDKDLQLLLEKAQRSADGRMVGVFVKGGLLSIPGTNETPERFVPIPDCVAPIRAIMGVDGSHNLSFAFDGQAHNVLLALDSLKNVELVMVREDIPAYRNATLSDNFDPTEAARPRTR